MEQRLVELAHERRRFGYRRLHALVRREGVMVNHKRVWRLYQKAGLAVHRRRRRRGVAVDREPLAMPTAPNQVWSMDFVMDALSDAALRDRSAGKQREKVFHAALMVKFLVEGIMQLAQVDEAVLVADEELLEPTHDRPSLRCQSMMW